MSVAGIFDLLKNLKEADTQADEKMAEKSSRIGERLLEFEMQHEGSRLASLQSKRRSSLVSLTPTFASFRRIVAGTNL